MPTTPALPSAGAGASLLTCLSMESAGPQRCIEGQRAISPVASSSGSTAGGAAVAAGGAGGSFTGSSSACFAAAACAAAASASARSFDRRSSSASRAFSAAFSFAARSSSAFWAAAASSAAFFAARSSSAFWAAAASSAAFFAARSSSAFWAAAASSATFFAACSSSASWAAAALARGGGVKALVPSAAAAMPGVATALAAAFVGSSASFSKASISYGPRAWMQPMPAIRYTPGKYTWKWPSNSEAHFTWAPLGPLSTKATSWCSGSRSTPSAPKLCFVSSVACFWPSTTFSSSNTTVRSLALAMPGVLPMKLGSTASRMPPCRCRSGTKTCTVRLGK
mmetsp:Transcript_18053/g.49827  ORF Transcript_18053/g.49827 Transcript_18053/m.49827 type:complete len:338 (-) Transcript_18053:126-1139(-)